MIEALEPENQAKLPHVKVQSIRNWFWRHRFDSNNLRLLNTFGTLKLDMLISQL